MSCKWVVHSYGIKQQLQQSTQQLKRPRLSACHWWKNHIHSTISQQLLRKYQDIEESMIASPSRSFELELHLRIEYSSINNRESITLPFTYFTMLNSSKTMEL